MRIDKITPPSGQALRNFRRGWPAPVEDTLGYKPFLDAQMAPHKKKKGLLRRLWIAFKWLTALGLLAGGITAYILWQYLFTGMPNLPADEVLWTTNRSAAVEFRDMSGTLLATRGAKYGRPIDLSDLPDYVPNAFIAAEDKRFYEHDGADNTAIARAVWSNFQAGRTVSGASTITQQVIKNFVLDNERSLKRKAQEFRLAKALEKRLDKKEILELYLSRVGFGAGFYGLDAASRGYFGVPPSEMTLAQASLLAGIVKAPSRLALHRNLDAAKIRQAYVLKEMISAGFVSYTDVQTALESEITVSEHDSENARYGYIFDYALAKASEKLSDLPPDIVITLNIDTGLQKRVWSHLRSEFSKYAKDGNVSELSAIIIDKRGRIRAMVGGREYEPGAYNRATQAQRQPGSSFKPFVYAAGLEAKISPFDIYFDAPITIGNWKPRNYTRQHLGPMSVSEALMRSTNTIAAEIGNTVGTKKVTALARRFGITSTLQPHPSVTLGSEEVTLIDLTASYGAFMTLGRRVDPWLISKIQDTRGVTLYEYGPRDGPRVFSAELAKIMNAMLRRVVNDRAGTGRRARLKGWDVAGKTGTSQEWRDAWFIGYTADYVGGVWVGNDDNSPMKGVTGGELPAILWHDMMEIALKGRKPKPLAGANMTVEPSEEAADKIDLYRKLTMTLEKVAYADQNP